MDMITKEIKRGWGATIKVLADYLKMAQHERSARQEIVDDEPEWVHYERGVLLDCVNDMRREDGKESVTLEQVKDAETHASGHCDYTQAFAANCAKLVFGIPIRDHAVIGVDLRNSNKHTWDKFAASRLKATE
jgi:hypothetical protein